MTQPELSRKCAQIRRESGALLVLVIRSSDVAFSVDPQLAPKDAGELLDGEISNFVEAISQQRKR